MPIFCSCGLVVDSSVDGYNNKVEKTRQWDVSHQLKFSRMLNALVDMKVVYTFNQSDHIKNMRVDVDDIVYCKHNLEEKTREVADIGMYNIN